VRTISWITLIHDGMTFSLCLVAWYWCLIWHKVRVFIWPWSCNVLVCKICVMVKMTMIHNDT
jgi:hypothetical protein